MRRTRKEYSAAQSAPQHSTCPRPRPAGMVKPSLAPMKTTTASGRPPACLTDSLPQSSKAVLDTPVPMWGSRSTFTPASASRRARITSSGWTSESPVTSSFRSGPARRGLAPTAAGSNESGVTGGTAPHASCAERPRSRCPDRVVVGRDPPERLVADLGERQLVGHPAGRMADGEYHGALYAGLHLLARVPDRGTLEQHQQEERHAHHDHRIPRAQAGAARGLRDAVFDACH